MLSVLLLAVAVPIASPPQAIVRLRTAKNATALKGAVKDVTAACRGKLRHSLRDNPQLHAEAKRIATTKSVEERMAALDLYRCFSEAKNAQLITPNLSHADPKMVAYAAEATARIEYAGMTAPLLAELAKKKAKCLAPGLAKPDIEVCVWLTYAMGPGLGAADAATKTNAGDAAAAMFEAPYAKVREVAVETVAATQMKKYKPALKKLIAAEKKGAFAEKNDAALLGRFKDRLKKLKK